jgi:hypothetical protein
MAMKLGLIALCAAGVVAIIGAGYFGRQHLVCSGLEQELLNSTSQARSLTAIGASAEIKADQKDIATLREEQMDRAKSALESLYAQCGKAAGETAFRKALMPVQP